MYVYQTALAAATFMPGPDFTTIGMIILYAVLLKVHMLTILLTPTHNIMLQLCTFVLRIP